MTAIPCPRCGTHIHLTTQFDPDMGTLNVRLVPHTCYRILVAECWEAGEVIAVWHSDHPGTTGPRDMVLVHGAEADRGWRPPAGDGWTYRWQLDEAVLANPEA